MAISNGTVGEIVKALDIACVEMLIISLPDSRIIDITSSLGKAWGCSKYEAVGQQLSQSENNPFYARYVNDSLTDVGGHGDLQVEIVTNLPHKQPITRKFKPRHYKDDNAEYLLLIGAPTQKTMDTKNEEDETRLQLAVEAGGYSTWEADLENHVGSFAPEIFALLGLVTKDNKISNAKWTSLIHPEDLPRTLTAKSSSFADEQKFVRTQYRIKNRDGNYIWLEMVARIIKDPITNSVKKFVGLCRDCSKEMNQRHKIETSEQNLARSQALAKMGSWVLNLKTGYVEWSDNMYALVGIDKSGQKQKNFNTLTDLMSPEQKEKWDEALEMAILGQSISDFECEFTKPNGKKHRISNQIDIEYNAAGEPVGLHGICIDITERIMLERQFLQAQKMESVGQLTGGIAHDFNNLLMVVLGNLQLLEKLTRDDEKAAHRLVTAIDAVNKGSELTKRLLAFSRQQTLETETILVNDLIDEMKDMLIRAINSTIELTLETDTETWPVNADKTQLETAILNLSINARDAMQDGGSLTIETTNKTLEREFTKQHTDLMPGDYVVISVTDTGTGMPPEIIDKVLQPFFTTKEVGAGSGLGLSMIYGFVKQSKGHLDISSAEGKGTTIKIFLPRCAESHESKTRQDEIANLDEQKQDNLQAPPALKKPIVLIAEDNDPVRDVAVAMIEDMDYIVLDAPNGEEALEIIKQRNDIDLLLSDVVMPGMNGPELAAEALKIRPELKVLFASGYTQGTAEEMHELPNFIELIDKPFTQDELTSKVRAAIESQLASAAA